MPSRLRRHDECGHIHFLTISCFRRLQFFRHESVNRVFVDGMRRVRQKLGVRWLGYVVMPEHVHRLVLPQTPGRNEPVPISSVLQHLKQFVGRNGKEALREVWRDRRSLGTAPLDRWAQSTGQKPFWKPRAYDFNITNHSTLLTKLEYVHKNPVTRGLVARPEDWAWSSYRYYELGDESLIVMDWDGAWPIV